MLDKPPPSRWTIKEIKGRLVVMDNETGAPPLSAAERMAEWDAQHGGASRPAANPQTPQQRAASPSAPTQPASFPRRGPSPNPWASQPSAPPTAIAPHSPPTSPASATTSPASPLRPAEKIFSTSRAWDSKGPRTIRLGDKGQQYLSKMLMIGFAALIFAEIFIWSSNFPNGVLIHAVMIAILWPQRADIGARALDHLIAQDKKSQ